MGERGKAGKAGEAVNIKPSNYLIMRLFFVAPLIDTYVSDTGL